MATIGHVTKQAAVSAAWWTVLAAIQPIEYSARIAGGPSSWDRFRRVRKRASRMSEKSYVSLSLAAPEFGPRKVYGNLGRAAGQDDDDPMP